MVHDVLLFPSLGLLCQGKGEHKLKHTSKQRNMIKLIFCFKQNDHMTSDFFTGLIGKG